MCEEAFDEKIINNGNGDCVYVRRVCGGNDEIFIGIGRIIDSMPEVIIPLSMEDAKELKEALKWITQKTK